MTEVHKKKDGYLLVKTDGPNGSCRFLTFWESIRYQLFGTLPND